MCACQFKCSSSIAGSICKLEDIDGRMDIATGTTLTVSFKKWVLRDPVCSLPTQ